MQAERFGLPKHYADSLQLPSFDRLDILAHRFRYTVSLIFFVVGKQLISQAIVVLTVDSILFFSTLNVSSQIRKLNTGAPSKSTKKNWFVTCETSQFFLRLRKKSNLQEWFWKPFLAQHRRHNKLLDLSSKILKNFISAYLYISQHPIIYWARRGIRTPDYSLQENYYTI